MYISSELFSISSWNCEIIIKHSYFLCFFRQNDA